MKMENGKFLLILLLIVGCNKLKDGIVVDKSIEPECTYVYMSPVVCGKTTTYIPMVMHDDADYKITISGVYENKKIDETFYVSKQRFDSIKNGQYIWVDGGCNQSPNEDTEIKK